MQIIERSPVLEPLPIRSLKEVTKENGEKEGEGGRAPI